MLPLLIALLAPTPADRLKVPVDTSTWATRTVEHEPLASLSVRSVRFEWKTPPDFESRFSFNEIMRSMATFTADDDPLSGMVIIAAYCPSTPKRCRANMHKPKASFVRGEKGAKVTHDRRLKDGRELIVETGREVRYMRYVLRKGWKVPALCTVSLQPSTLDLLPGIAAACGTIDKIVVR